VSYAVVKATASRARLDQEAGSVEPAAKGIGGVDALLGVVGALEAKQHARSVGMLAGVGRSQISERLIQRADRAAATWSAHH
jgi:hypothetical protein